MLAARYALSPRACARAFALLVLLGAPLFATRGDATAFTVVDGVASWLSAQNGGRKLAGWRAVVVEACYYPDSAIARFSGRSVEATATRITRKAAQMHEALGEAGARECALGCALALLGSVKYCVNGDIGPYGVLAALELGYSVFAKGLPAMRANVVGTTCVVVFGALSSPSVRRRARARAKRD